MSNAVTKPLTTRQKAFAEAYVSNGGKVKQAAEEAGYAAGHGANSVGHKNLKLPAVQQYIMELVAETFGLSAPRAVKTVVDLAEKGKSEYVRLQAAQDLLDRAGFKPIDRTQVQIAGDIHVEIDLG